MNQKLITIRKGLPIPFHKKEWCYPHVFKSNISNTRDSVSAGYPNTEKRVKTTTLSGVFLTKIEVFG